MSIRIKLYRHIINLLWSLYFKDLITSGLFNRLHRYFSKRLPEYSEWPDPTSKTAEAIKYYNERGNKNGQ